MPDDALITLSFARNLAEHGCWCLVDGVESNTATSPLNVWLLAGVVRLTGHAFWAAAAVLAASLAAIGTWMRTLGGGPAAVLAMALVTTSPIFASAVGLESALVAAVLVGLVRYAVDGRWLATGVLLAAAWFARPDLVIPAFVVVGGGALLARGPGLLRSLPVALLLVAPWAAFSWWHFGSIWANSVAVKWANGSWGGHTLTDVAFFAGQWPLVTLITVATLLGGLAATVLALIRGLRGPALLGTAGLAHLVALSLTETPPIFYYVAPALSGLAMALVLVAVRSRAAVVVPVGLVLLSVGCLVAVGGWWAAGIPPIRQNWATNAQYAAIAAELPTDGVVLGGEIGGLAFYCHDRCAVVDPVLSDPGRTDVLVSRWRQMHPDIARVNYARYVAPPRIPVRYRLHTGLVEPGPGPSWPITRNPGIDQWATLEPARDPFMVSN